MSSRRSDTESDASAAAAALVLFAALLGHCTAHAQELPPPEAVESQCAPEVVQGRRVLITHQGEVGIWFQGAVARCMAQRLALLPQYARYTALLEQRLSIADERHGLQERATALAREEAAEARGQLETALRRAREAEESRDAWYRSPTLWFVVGVVVTSAAAVALAAITRSD